MFLTSSFKLLDNFSASACICFAFCISATSSPILTAPITTKGVARIAPTIATGANGMSLIKSTSPSASISSLFAMSPFFNITALDKSKSKQSAIVFPASNGISSCLSPMPLYTVAFIRPPQNISFLLKQSVETPSHPCWSYANM